MSLELKYNNETTQKVGKNFQCGDCDAAFTRKVHLEDHHNAKHRNYFPFECLNCKCKFASKYTLNKHKK